MLCFYKAKLCHKHLQNCENFKVDYNEDEVLEILLWSVPEDAKKKGKKAVEVAKVSTKSKNEISNMSITKLSTSISTETASQIKKQTILSHYVLHSLSDNDKSHFENLILQMIVSNGLSFNFMENQETWDVFNYIMPTLKLLNSMCR